jgi:hypothetical protein
VPLIPIYRPEITTYRRDDDGLWVSERGTFVWTFFRPMADEARREVAPGCRRDVVNGSTPAFTILAPEDAELVERGASLSLRLASGKLLDGIQALIAAKRDELGLSLEGRPTSADPDSPPRPMPAAAPLPTPSRARGPAVQMAMFG